MTEEPLISIIIPVYNTEKYLDVCVQSILCQEYKKIEVIIINDGSNDMSPNICDKWALSDNRVKVFHQNNRGLSASRNLGMKLATGEYISFVDSDDWMHESMLKKLLEQIRLENSQIACCDAIAFYDDVDYNSQIRKPKEIRVFDREGALRELVNDSLIKAPVWNRLYQAKLIKDILFPVNKLHEDEFWSYQVISKADKISYISDPLYYYRQRPGSIIHSKFSLRNLDAIEAKELRLNYLARYHPSLVNAAVEDLMIYCIYAGQRVLRDIDDYNEREIAIHKITNLVNNKYQKTIACDNISIKYRIWFTLAKMNFKLTCRIRNFLNIGT